MENTRDKKDTNRKIMKPLNTYTKKNYSLIYRLTDKRFIEKMLIIKKKFHTKKNQTSI